MVEGARLESVYTSKAYRGFESHPLRHRAFRSGPIPAGSALIMIDADLRVGRSWIDGEMVILPH